MVQLGYNEISITMKRKMDNYFIVWFLSIRAATLSISSTII